MSCAALNGNSGGQISLLYLQRAGQRWFQCLGRAGAGLCCWAATSLYGREQQWEAGGLSPA